MVADCHAACNLLIANEKTVVPVAHTDRDNLGVLTGTRTSLASVY